jgi:hypothetical protein
MRFQLIGAATIVVAAGMALADGGPAHQAWQTRPVKMGTSGGEANDASSAYCCGGTLGALVMRDGVLCILSCNHVLARSGSAITGDDTVQPGLIDSQCLASAANAVGDFAGNLVPLGTANVDTALSVARAGMVDTSGAILDIGPPCTSPQTPVLNMQVMKSGRTTGLTTGRITSVHTSVSIQYQRGCNAGRKFTVSYTNQIVTTNMSSAGDSGSLLVSNDGTPNPVGLLFAGSSSATVYNPIQDVVNAYTSGGHTFSFVGNTCATNIAEPLVVGPGPDSIAAALKVKVEHEHDLMKTPGVCGVGVGCLENDDTKSAIVIFREKPANGRDDDMPKDYDGVPVRIIYTEPFAAQ